MNAIYHGTSFNAVQLRALLSKFDKVSVSFAGALPEDMTGADAAAAIEDNDHMTLACGGGYTPQLVWDRSDDDRGWIAFSSLAQKEDATGWFIEVA